MNVTNLQIKISEDCPKNIKESILKYWKIENDAFLYKPKTIAKSLEIPTHKLSALIKESSECHFETPCDYCFEEIKHIVSSQTAFNYLTHQSEYVCQSCSDLIEEKERIEAEKEREERIKSLKNALKNKNWEHLNRYQFKIFNDIIHMDSFSSLLKQYRNTKNNLFWSAIFTLRDLDLIVLIYSSFGASVVDIQYLNELKELLPDYLIKNDNNEDVTFNKETNELRFKLTKNPNQYSYDSPEYSGTLEFKQNIVLKPGVEYSFGAWKRQNDVLYLTIIPTEDKPLLPKQKNKAW